MQLKHPIHWEASQAKPYILILRMGQCRSQYFHDKSQEYIKMSFLSNSFLLQEVLDWILGGAVFRNPTHPGPCGRS